MPSPAGAHTRTTRAAWRLSPADAKVQAPGDIYTARPSARRRCSASSPVRQQVGASARTRRVCVQQAAVALTSRQQRRSSTLSWTLLTRLGDE
eukprot:22905-Prymnesium_polylepis.1